MIENAKEEILIIFPTFNAVKIQQYSLKTLLNQKHQETVKIRILSPMKNDVTRLLFSKTLPGGDIDSSSKEYTVIENIDIREIAKQQVIKSTILIVDKKYHLAIELKDDSQDTFEESTGLATYSSSRPTILSNISVFESLWTEIELYEKLKHANKKLEIHDKMQKDFINMAAHELRTPSQAILGYAELSILSERYNKTNKNTEYLDKIVKNAERLSKLIQNCSTWQKLRIKY